MSDDKCCKDCRFFSPLNAPIEGECRRRAPRFTANAELYENWAIVEAYKWCGEFEPNKTEEE